METISVAPTPTTAMPQAPHAETSGVPAAPFAEVLKQGMARANTDTAQAPAGAWPVATAAAQLRDRVDAQGRPVSAAATPAAELSALIETAALLQSAELDDGAGTETQDPASTAVELERRIDPEPSAVAPELIPVSVQSPVEQQLFQRSSAGLAAGDETQHWSQVDTSATSAQSRPDMQRDALTGTKEPLSKSSGENAQAANLLPERGASEASAGHSHTAASLESLTSLALASRWSVPQPGIGGTASAAPVATARIETPMGQAGWGEALNQKIVWLVDRQQQSAELHVNPPHLGPIDVVLNLGAESTHIAFASPHAAVREAIEASLAELRDALAQNGVTLGEAHVSSDSGAARKQLEAESSGAGTQDTSSDDGVPELPQRRAAARGLVDLFA